MDPDKTGDWLQNRREEIRESNYREEVSRAILTFLDAHNPDAFDVDAVDSSTLTDSSRLAYASTLHRTAQSLDLLQCTTTDLNRLAKERVSGRHPSVKDDGITENTVHQNQVAWRSFYRFHENHPDGVETNVDVDAIVLVDREDTSVDERDMFDDEEIKAMRNGCTNTRDRCLLEMLIFTGQRHNALRLLKYRDVKPEEGKSGVIYLPDSKEGLKGAEGKRPLLGAQKYAQRWKDQHPTKQADHAFFTHLYDWDGHDTIEPGDHLSSNSFGRITKRIADRAGVEKDANPHQFRHYFVTQAVANHGMSMDTVRHLIGHADDSRELERTYQHLVDDDHIENAELDMGIREEREESLTPTTCFTCDEPLQPSWSACPNCGRTYGPDAVEIDEELQTRKAEGAIEAIDPEDQQALRTLLDVLDDEEFRNQLLALVGDREADSLADAVSSSSSAN